jgi:AraC-like DNA-binding protein
MNRQKTDKPRGVLKTATAAPERYRHARYHPSPDLAPYVEHYWAVEWDLRGLPAERAETLPHPSVHLIFERDGGGREASSRVAGVARGRFSRELSGQGGVIAVKFRPGGFYPFVNEAISAFTDKVIPVAQVFAAAGEAAARSVFAAGDDAARISALECFLRERQPVADEQVPRVAALVYGIAGDRDITKVEDLVERCGLNVRALQRLFAKYVGVSPKWVIQRYRLHEAAEQLASNRTLSQTDLALSLGYSDQAHFSRDFKAVVGTSPAAYARRAGK